MNATNVELARQLYRISGWDKTHMAWAVPTEGDFKPWLRPGVGSSSAYTEHPAYDLAYLLRKIGEKLRVSVEYCRLDQKLAMDLKEWEGQWIAYTPYMKQGDYPFADSPEDAAASLALHLFEQGVLEKSS